MSSRTPDFDEQLYSYYERRASWPRDQIYDPLTSRRDASLIAHLAREVDRRGGGRRLLDVGSGVGQFVDGAARAGWDALGIDLARAAVEIAQRLGAPVRRLDLFSPVLAPESFDVVTMSEVIEHVSNPGDFLERIESLLRPHGLAYLTTPNFACLDRRLLGSQWPPIHPEHLVYFTPTTLTALVQRRTKLRVIHRETRNVSAAALRALFPRRARQGPGHHGRPDTTVETAPTRADEARLRAVTESSASGRLAKRLVNRILDTASMGNTLVMLLERPARS